MEIKAVGIRRVGDELEADAVIEVELPNGKYVEVGRVDLGKNFSCWWNLNALNEKGEE